MFKNVMIRFFFTLFLMSGLALAQSSQSGGSVKEALDDALKTHIRNLYAPKGCPRNDMVHNYTKGIKVVKKQEVSGTLRLWGQAGVNYRNARTGGDGRIQFYAELRKDDGEIYVSRLRWKVGECMKYKTLYEI